MRIGKHDFIAVSHAIEDCQQVRGNQWGYSDKHDGAPVI
jgi:hypothetical protein